MNGTLKQSVDSSLRCPFPDCGERQTSCVELSDGVYLCEQCGRLSHRCVHESCRSLSRPFSRYCRQCGRTQSEEIESPGEARWSAFAQFDRPWRFSNSVSIPDEPQTILDLQEIEGYLAPQGLLAIAWIDGMIALHQAGAFAAIIHPFAENAKQHGHSPLCWSVQDPNRVRTSRELNAIRAFPPVPTNDRQFVLFSSPRSCFGVATSCLPGWGVSGQPESFSLLNEQLLAGNELAAAPVPLSLANRGNTSSAQCRIGCLLRSADRATYRWLVIEIKKSRSRIISEGTLPLIGSPAQILVAHPAVLVFATPKGHWWWKWQEACSEDPHPPRRSFGERDADPELQLDRQIEEHHIFSWRRQHLRSESGEQFSSDTKAVVVGYECQGGAGAGFYKIAISEGRAEYHTPLTSSGKLIPIGTDGADLLLIGNTRDKQDAELYRLSLGTNTAEPSPGAVTPDLLNVNGIQVRSPLMVLVCNDTGKRFRVRVLRLDSGPSYDPVEIAGLSLWSDPIVCAKFILTVEQQGDQIQLVRRRLPIIG